MERRFRGTETVYEFPQDTGKFSTSGLTFRCDV